MEISVHNTESFGGSSNPNGYDNQESSSISSVSELPSFIIFEILLKLPIKSIIRCRLVCRTWKNLISEKYFANLYLKNPPFNILVKSERIMVDGIVRYSFNFLEIGLNGDITPTPFNPKALNFVKSGWVLISKGSCNGLLCLVQRPRVEFRQYALNNEIVYIVNPILGEVTMLPQVNQTEDKTFVDYGFGFSTQSERYKVLRLVSRKRDGHRHGEIFTIGVDHKWRYVEEDFWLPFEVYPWGINLNGLLYFASNTRSIFAFDIEEERGHQISYPRQLFGHPGLTALAVCNGNICLSDHSTNHQLVIWTMMMKQRYGDVESSWSRETILKSWIPFDLCNDQLIPITTLRNGDLLLSRFSFFSSKGLISYNQKTNECRKITYHEEANVMFFDYVPSFFSLNTNN